MAITFYGGVMGSGKSYEVVSGPVCDAVAAGRRVVTNVAGINEAKIHDYLVSKRTGINPKRLGRIVHVTDERVMQAGFFPDEKKPEAASVVQGGDLVVIDEAWRFWDGKLPEEHMQFFRMHRHYVHADTGVTCDVVLISQDINGLHRSLKAVIELSFRMHKLKSIGQPRAYRVEMYEGYKQNKSTRVSTFVKKYQKDVFPLYKSYDGENAKEVQVDKRQNMLRDPKVIGTAVVVVLVWAFGGYFTYRFFARHGGDTPKVDASASAQLQSASAAAAMPAPGNAKGSGGGSSSGKGAYSSEWRVAGTYEANGERYVVVSDSQGRLRVESPSMFRNSGIAAIGEIDGERVALWTGKKASGAIVSPLEAKK